MAKTPIEMMLDGMEWVAIPPEGEAPNDGIPFATHSGVLEIAGCSLRCYRLNTGEAVIEAEDMERFFDGMAGE